MRAAFSNQGKICLCGSRILVERSVYAQFVREFVTRVKALRVGDPRDQRADRRGSRTLRHSDGEVPGRLGRLSCEVRIAPDPCGVRIDVDVQAPLIERRMTARPAT